MKVAIIGAGRIGKAVRKYLSFVTSPDNCAIFDTEVTLFDLEAYDVWVVATPFSENKKYIEAACRLSKVYIDFTEDIENRKLAENMAFNLSSDPAIAFSKAKFIPMCGLAPGWVSIIANGIAKQFDSVKCIDIRVGALPTSSMNAMKYALTWSADGLVNEYFKDAEIVEGGKKLTVQSLTGLENIIINGKPYEAFYTSGGIGTLIDTWLEKSQKPDHIAYKTVRYPGHYKTVRYPGHLEAWGTHAQMKENTQEEVTKAVKEHVPTTRQDVVVVYIEVMGIIDGQCRVHNFVHEFHAHGGSTAIEITTAMGALVWLDYLKERGLDNIKPFNKQEDMPYDFFIQSFKSLYVRIYEKGLDMKLSIK